jgi:hypothetical protein
MGWFDGIAHLFGFDDGQSKPSQQDFEDAQIIDEFLREDGEGEPYFEEGEEMDTVPSSNPGYEGEDTDKHDTSFLRRLLGW